MPKPDGYYWYRATNRPDVLSAGQWVIVSVGHGYASVEFLNDAIPVDELPGEWHGPLQPPDARRDSG